MSDIDYSDFAPAGSIVTLQLDNNDALNDGLDAITAVATVTKDSAGVKGVKVYFQLISADKAIFSVPSTYPDHADGVSNDSGTVSKAFTDTEAEEGEVHVYIKFEDGTKSVDDKDFTFKTPVPDKVTVTFEHNEAEAGGVQTITATALATRKDMATGQDVPLSNQLIHFVLPDSAAYFTGAEADKNKDGDSITQGKTNSDGKVFKDFADLKCEQGDVNAYFSLGIDLEGVEQKVMGDAKFTFVVPASLQISLAAVQGVCHSNGQATSFKGNKAATDDEDSFTATATVTIGGVNNTRVPLEGIDVDFSLPAQMTPYGEDRDKWVDNHVIIITGENGTATSPHFASNTVIKDLLTATVFTPTLSKQDTTPFSFSVPWQGVKDLYCNFSGGLDKALIYANGRHQALLRIRMTLTKEDTIPLDASNQPTLDEVTRDITFIDYQTRMPLGEGNLTGWKYTRTPNIFDKQLLVSAAEGEIVQASDDEWQDGVKDGVVRLSYYFTCDDDELNKNLQIGFTVSPPGADGTVLYNALNGEFENPVSLYGKTQKMYATKDILINPTAVNSGAPDDYATRDDDNLWRQWDYQIRLDSIDGTFIFRCQVDDTSRFVQNNKGVSLPFARSSRLFYNYAAYFWPNNVRDENDIPLPATSYYYMQIGGETRRRAEVPAGRTDTLYCTFYATSGNGGAMDDECTPGTENISPNGHLERAVYITIYDQYGNKGEFTVDPRELPQRYDVKKIHEYKILTTGHVSGIDGYSYGDYPVSVRIQKADGSSFVDYAQWYKDNDGYIFQQLGVKINNSKFNTYTLNKDEFNRDNGIVFRTAEAWSEGDNYQNLVVMPVRYSYTSFPGVVYSTKSQYKCPNYYTYLYPIWQNNSFAVGLCDVNSGFQTMTLETHGSDSHSQVYAYINNYPQSNRDYEFIFV